MSSNPLTGYGPHTSGMLDIIEQVHREVDEHRVRNGQGKWDWSLKNLVRAGIREFPRTGWLAKFLIANNHGTIGTKNSRHRDPLDIQPMPSPNWGS